MNVSGTMNPDYLANITAKGANVQTELTTKVAEVGACTACAELARLQGVINGVMTTELTDFQDQITAYFVDQVTEVAKSAAALNALTTIPTDLGEVISWITTLISTQFSGPYAKVITLQAEIIAQQTAKLAEITTLVSNLNSLKADLAAKSSTLSCGL